MESIFAMAEIGRGEKGGSRRLALTDEDKAGRDLFVQWCEASQCEVTVDDMGNIFARRAGENNALPPVCSGSHLDTQPHGGKYDGIFGVLAALEVVRTLNDHNITTKVPIEVVNWTNEEGSRFAPAMLSSGVFAGLFEKEYAYTRSDSAGAILKDELARIGYAGSEPCGDHPMTALLEAHIEQGPVLEKNGEKIGIVTGSQGQRWFDITIEGQDSHAGSTPMLGRRDALAAAADVIKYSQHIARSHSPHGVGTVGEISVSPNSRNTIPGHVFLTLDFRHPDDLKLAEMAEIFRQKCKTLSQEEGVEIEIKEIWHNPPVSFNQGCIDAVSNATKELGYKHRKMVSGAGHDAIQLSRVVPSSMIFIPCEGGLSHNEQEHATPEDIEAGCNVLLHAMIDLAS